MTYYQIINDCLVSNLDNSFMPYASEVLTERELDLLDVDNLPRNAGTYETEETTNV